MFIRKFGKLLRGNATAFQIFSATILCGLLGSLPGLGQAPLLLISLLFLLIILNANLFLGAITLIVAKLLSLALLPVSFKVGIWLVEDAAPGLVSSLVNAPVTAWFGFDYYVTLPSLFIGLLTGLALGLLVSRGLSGFRSRMAKLETGSERYQAYTSKFWVRGLAWLIAGGVKGKKSWSELEQQAKGLPVRPLGIAFVVATGVLIVVGLKFLDRTILTTLIRDNLEAANGATVDLGGVEIIAGQNRVIISGLALANPEDLSTNRFSSREITADLSGLHLLKKKVVIDSLQILEPRAGESRRIPGRRLVEAPPPDEPFEPSNEVIDIDAYLGQASVWRDRLRTFKRIYDRMAPFMKKDEASGKVQDSPLSWREQLAIRAKELGYAKVKSDTLISDQPRLWIRELKSDNLVIAGSAERFIIAANNLSTQPALLRQQGTLRIEREDGELGVTLSLPWVETPNTSSLRVRYANLDISELERSSGRELPMDGGTMDIEGGGTITGGLLDLPLKVTLKNTTLNAFGNAMAVDQLPLEVNITGPLDKPTLNLPKTAIEDMIKAGGRKKIENLIQEKAGDQIKGLFKLGG